MTNYNLNTPPPFVLNNRVTDIEQYRLDILVIGNRAAGKTMFIGSLLQYLKSLNGFSIISNSKVGYALASFMLQTLDDEILAERFPMPTFISIPFDIKKKSYNIIKTEGNNGIGSLPRIIENINKSQNPRVILITIPIDELVIKWESCRQDSIGNIYTEQSEMMISGFYSSIIHKLENNNVLAMARGVGLILTKWDKAKTCGYSSIEQFMNRNCKSLDRTIRDLKKITEMNLTIEFLSIL